MLVVLLFSVLSQAVTVHLQTKEGPIATAAALLGLKPIMDGVNVIFDLPRRPGAMRCHLAFGLTRMIETSTKSIPFAVM
jgi:hypothetical protein